jgi:hypothetical protein
MFRLERQNIGHLETSGMDRGHRSTATRFVEGLTQRRDYSPMITTLAAPSQHVQTGCGRDIRSDRS